MAECTACQPPLWLGRSPPFCGLGPLCPRFLLSFLHLSVSTSAWGGRGRRGKRGERGRRKEGKPGEERRGEERKGVKKKEKQGGSAVCLAGWCCFSSFVCVKWKDKTIPVEERDMMSNEGLQFYFNMNLPLEYKFQSWKVHVFKYWTFVIFWYLLVRLPTVTAYFTDSDVLFNLLILIKLSPLDAAVK